jgi:hypothetical protein
MVPCGRSLGHLVHTCVSIVSYCGKMVHVCDHPAESKSSNPEITKFCDCEFIRVDYVSHCEKFLLVFPLLSHGFTR